MSDLDPAAVEAAHEQVPFGEGGHVQADEAEARAAQPSGDGMPLLSKLDPEWAKYIRRVEDMLAEARASLERETQRADDLNDRCEMQVRSLASYANSLSEAIARAEKAERERDEAREQIAWTVQRCNEAIGDGFNGNANSAVAAVCDRLASLAGGEHRAGLNDKEGQDG